MGEVSAGKKSGEIARRGVAILLLLSLVQFMDILDASILNIALPSIKNDLGFSQQGLVLNPYAATVSDRLRHLVVRRAEHQGGQWRKTLN